MGREKSPKGWHTEDIKSALRKKHGSLKSLALSWGKHQATISVALYGGSYMPAIEERIAKELGEHPHTIWPDRWHPDGSPKSVAERNIRPVSQPSHRSNAKAA